MLNEHPERSLRRIYRFFAAFFFPPLAAFFAIFFSSGCCDPASDEPLGRHYGWAEPSTLIPDVDYGGDFFHVKHKSARVVKKSALPDTPIHVYEVKCRAIT